MNRRQASHAFAWLFIGAIVLSSFSSTSVRASIGSCVANITPHQVLVNSQTDFVIQLDNTDANTIHWIQIPQLAGYYSVESASAGGWSVGIDADAITFTGGSLAPGESAEIHLVATAAPDPRTVYWNVQVSDGSGGGVGRFCDGDTSVESTQTEPPQLSGITIANVGAHTITLNWQTNQPATSQVRYGTTAGYGSQSPVGSTLRTSHQVTLSGLMTNTAYHYQVISGNSNGGSVSEDSTFLTAIEEKTGGGSIPDKNDSATSVSVPVKAVPTEHVPPTVSLSTNLTKPFAKAPTMSGMAADNEAVARVEYSTDGGKNWQLVDSALGISGKKVSFSFTPSGLEDGNYGLLVQAVDTSNNKAATAPQTLIIDRLPPEVGGTVNSIGAQIVSPGISGIIYGLVGVDQKVTLSAVGGATQIQLRAKRGGQPGGVFTLTHSQDNGLWSGIISFTHPGSYTLVAEALDGAGNRTQRDLQTLLILPSTKLVDQATGKPVARAKLTVFYLEPESNTWTVWDSAAYGQQNPQRADVGGNVNFLLPSGTYYLQAEAPRYRTVMTNIFSLNESTPLTADITFKKLPFGVPMWFPTVQKFKTSSHAKTQSRNQLVADAEAPNFNLRTTESASVSLLSYAGKPTVLSFVSTWSPPAKEQLGVLAATQSNPDINVVAVNIQENGQKVKASLQIAGYTMPMIVDQDGTMVEPYRLQSLPTHYFLDRHGAVKKVMVGVLSKEELLDGLGGL
ncbi:MAG TPA: redoxin domain-containing protein [Candidatus Saccharimonadia bacterium]